MDIHPNAKIGEGILFDHGNGLVNFNYCPLFCIGGKKYFLPQNYHLILPFKSLKILYRICQHQ
jgi:hypothetical protein